MSSDMHGQGRKQVTSQIRLTASRHTELTSPYVHLISTIAHRVKGRERAETKQ